MLTDTDLMLAVPLLMLAWAATTAAWRWLWAPEDTHPGLVRLLAAQHVHRRSQMLRAFGVYAEPEDVLGGGALLVVGAVLVTWLLVTA